MSDYAGMNKGPYPYLRFTLLYIQYPTPTIIAKTIIPIMIGAKIFMRKTIIAIIIINAIIPTIIEPSEPTIPILDPYYLVTLSIISRLDLVQVNFYYEKECNQVSDTIQGRILSL
jgi:hypothetical protein